MLLMVRNVEAGMSRWIAAMRLTGVGFFIGGCILLGVFAGLWLDNTLNTKPIFMLIGLFLGIVIAAYGVYQMLLPLISNKRDREKN